MSLEAWGDSDEEMRAPDGYVTEQQAEEMVREALVVSDEEVDALALHLCESESQHPEGTENKVLNDGRHSITFREIAKRRVRVIVNRLMEMRR